MRSFILMAGVIALAGTALAAVPAAAQAAARCCVSNQGPEPVPFTGAWANQNMSRDRCVAQQYGFWDGDPRPNDARRVCAVRGETPPDVPLDPVPPPNDRGGDTFYDPGVRPGAAGDDAGGGRQ